jgi:hypothetical protein
MGTIQENDKDNVFKRIIDDVGVLTALKMIDDIDVIVGNTTKETRINFIKEFVSEFFGGQGVALVELEIYPIFYDENNTDISQIEYVAKDGVYVDVYSKEYENHKTDFKIKYENLNDEILNELFKELIYSV